MQSADYSRLYRPAWLKPDMGSISLYLLANIYPSAAVKGKNHLITGLRESRRINEETILFALGVHDVNNNLSKFRLHIRNNCTCY